MEKQSSSSKTTKNEWLIILIRIGADDNYLTDGSNFYCVTCFYENAIRINRVWRIFAKKIKKPYSKLGNLITKNGPISEIILR